MLGGIGLADLATTLRTYIYFIIRGFGYRDGPTGTRERELQLEELEDKKASVRGIGGVEGESSSELESISSIIRR